MNDDSGIVVYTSSVSGNLKAKKAITRTLFIIKSSGAEFTEIDVSTDEAAKEFMVATSGKRTLPQVFVNGQYVGGFEEVEEANEYGEIRQLLGI